MKQAKAINIFVVAEQFRCVSKLATLVPRIAAANPRIGRDPAFAFLLEVPTTPTAAMANSAFSLELYFKCLIRLSRKHIGKEHDLEKLFALIGRRNRAKIKRYFVANSQQMRSYVEHEYRKNKRPVPIVDFEFTLRASKDAFIAMRYLHERGPGKDRGWLADVIVEGARQAILDMRPRWEMARQHSTLPETSIGSTTFPVR